MWNENSVKKTYAKMFHSQMLGLDQPFPTGCCDCDKTNMIFEGESLHVLRCTFLQLNRHLWKLASAITQENSIQVSSLTIPANANNLTNQIAKCVHYYFYFTYGHHPENGQRSNCKRFVTMKCLLWCNYSEIVVWYNKTQKFLVLCHANLLEIE